MKRKNKKMRAKTRKRKMKMYDIRFERDLMLGIKAKTAIEAKRKALKSSRFKRSIKATEVHYL
jgi:hypothetical protein